MQNDRPSVFLLKCPHVNSFHGYYTMIYEQNTCVLLPFFIFRSFPIERTCSSYFPLINVDIIPLLYLTDFYSLFIYFILFFISFSSSACCIVCFLVFLSLFFFHYYSLISQFLFRSFLVLHFK